jgi:hypothetical protein
MSNAIKNYKIYLFSALVAFVAFVLQTVDKENISITQVSFVTPAYADAPVAVGCVGTGGGPVGAPCGDGGR